MLHVLCVLISLVMLHVLACAKVASPRPFWLKLGTPTKSSSFLITACAAGAGDRRSSTALQFVPGGIGSSGFCCGSASGSGSGHTWGCTFGCSAARSGNSSKLCSLLSTEGLGSSVESSVGPNGQLGSSGQLGQLCSKQRSSYVVRAQPRAARSGPRTSSGRGSCPGCQRCSGNEGSHRC